MYRHVTKLIAAPIAILALAACAADTPAAPEMELAGPAFSVAISPWRSTVTNIADVGKGDVARIGVLNGQGTPTNRTNAIQILEDGLPGKQWCRSNGPGQDPGANSIRAIYEDDNEKPAALAYQGGVLWVYSRVEGVGNFVCQRKDAVVGGDNLRLGGNIPLPPSVGGGSADVFVVQNETNERVEFRRGTNEGNIIGRTNGAGNNGTLQAGWIGSDGKPYALILRPNGEEWVITPTFVQPPGVGFFPVNTVGRVTKP